MGEPALCRAWACVNCVVSATFVGHDRLVCRLVADWWAASEMRHLRDTSASARPTNQRTLSKWRIHDVHSFLSAAYIICFGYGSLPPQNSPVCFFFRFNLIAAFFFIAETNVFLLSLYSVGADFFFFKWLIRGFIIPTWSIICTK